MNKLLLCAVLVATCVLNTVACGESTPPATAEKPNIITVTKSSKVNHYYYNGVLSPIKNQAITSPFDGSVKTILFKYGQHVKKGQKLVVISSKSLSDKYRQALQAFFKAKDQYTTGKHTFVGTKKLHEAGLVADNDFLSAQSTQENNQLAYLQAKEALDKILKQAGIKKADIENLSISDTQKINALLNRDFNDIAIYAPNDGIALFPSSSDSGDDDDKGGKKLTVGEQVKEDKLLLTLGDLSGLATQVKVNEVDVNHIQFGQKVKITSPAFPGITLDGKVISVSSQAQSSDEGGSSDATFIVDITIPHLPQAARNTIRIGMTGKIDIIAPNPPHLFVPIAAIIRQNGKTYVMRVINNTHQRTPVITGFTTIDKIEIVSGLQPGDKIVANPNSLQSKDG